MNSQRKERTQGDCLKKKMVVVGEIEGKFR